MNMLRAGLVALLALPVAYVVFGNSGYTMVHDVPFVILDFGSAKREIDIRLVLVLVFLVGLLPMWLLGLAQRVVWRRRLARTERRLEDVETELERAKVELLRPPAASRAPVAPPPAAEPPAQPAAAPTPEPPPAPQSEPPAADPLVDPDA